MSERFDGDMSYLTLEIPNAEVRGMTIIMEIKIVKDFEQMEAGCEEALTQIEEQNYEASLYKEGYRRFLKYGVFFTGRSA